MTVRTQFWFGKPVKLGYLAHMSMVYLVARRTLGFRWQSHYLGLLALHTSLGVELLVLALIGPR
jgi:hypothetical protein